MFLPKIEESTVVFYHQDCVDGFISAVVSYYVFRDKAKYIPIQYQDQDKFSIEDFDLLKGKDVYLLDFSPTRDFVESIISSADFTTWIDHHPGSLDVWVNGGASLRDYSNDSTIILNTGKCGALLALEFWKTRGSDSNDQLFVYFPPNLTRLLEYVNDYDLYTLRLEGTKAMHEALTLRMKDDGAIEALSKDLSWNPECISELLLVGEALLRSKEGLIDEVFSNRAEYGVMNTYGYLVNAPRSIRNEVGERLSNLSNTYGIVYYLDHTGLAKCSVRSHPSSPVSARQIARFFGGEGHETAAGFSCEIADLLKYDFF